MGMIIGIVVVRQEFIIPRNLAEMNYRFNLAGQDNDLSLFISWANGHTWLAQFIAVFTLTSGLLSTKHCCKSCLVWNCMIDSERLSQVQYTLPSSRNLFSNSPYRPARHNHIGIIFSSLLLIAKMLHYDLKLSYVPSNQALAWPRNYKSALNDLGG